MDYSLTDLKNFKICSHSRTLTEASRKLSISQPALSESIKKLELAFGEKLFYRSPNGIALTPSGRAMVPKIQGILDELNHLTSSSNEDLFQDRILRIGAHPTVASYTLPKTFKALEKTSPDFRIEIYHHHSRVIQTEVQRGKLDLGIVVNPIKVPDLIIQYLCTDEVGIWTLSSKPKLNVVICDCELSQTQAILKKWNVRPDKIISTTHMDLIARLVSENLGVGILPRRAALLSEKKLQLIKNAPLVKDDLALVYRPEFGKIGFERAMIEAIKQSLS